MAVFISCNDSTRWRIARKVELLLDFIQQYRWIIEAYVSFVDRDVSFRDAYFGSFGHSFMPEGTSRIDSFLSSTKVNCCLVGDMNHIMLDFYTSNHWSKVPKCVREYFDATSPPDWAWLLTIDNKNDTPPSANISRPVPLILQALNVYTRYLSLKRTAVDLDSSDTADDIFNSLKSTTHTLSSSEKKDDCNTQNINTAAFQPSNYKNGQNMDMQHLYRRHVKPKKQHEIQKLGQVINCLSTSRNCKSVVDVGAGLGHLSRLLTFYFGLKVTTLEADGGHAPKASDFDKELKKDVMKKHKKILKTDSGDGGPKSSSVENLSSLSSHDIPFSKESKSKDKNPQMGITISPLDTSVTKSKEESSHKKITNLPLHADVTKSKDEIPQIEITNSPLPADVTISKPSNQDDDLPSHVICHISHDIATSQFLEVVKQNRLQFSDMNDLEEDDFIITGLHACGDLSPSLIKIFMECPSAVGLASVACCYMKMDHLTTDPCDSSKKVLDSYPMSNLLKKIPDHELTYESREMACHFADAYCKRLKDNSPHLKVHSYRAALQHIVTTVNPDFQSGKVRLVAKKGAQRSFSDYVAETLKKLNIDSAKIPQEMICDCEEMTSHWKRVVAFYTLRLSLAPVVESLILLDRVLFLKEEGFNSVLVPIFDSSISPRNFVLLAVKS